MDIKDIKPGRKVKLHALEYLKSLTGAEFYFVGEEAHLGNEAWDLVIFPEMFENFGTEVVVVGVDDCDDSFAIDDGISESPWWYIVEWVESIVE